MSIEQQDNNDITRKEAERKNEKEKQDFFESQKITLQTSRLLSKLARELSKEFGIDIAQAKNLLSGNIGSKLEDLKSSLGSNNTINFAQLQGAIVIAKDRIEDISKSYREDLKNSLIGENYTPENHEYSFQKRFISQNTKDRIISPSSFYDHVLGAGIGIIDSTEAIILFIYGLGKGILLTPYHLYLFITGQAVNPFKNL